MTQTRRARESAGLSPHETNRASVENNRIRLSRIEIIATPNLLNYPVFHCIGCDVDYGESWQRRRDSYKDVFLVMSCVLWRNRMKFPFFSAVRKGSCFLLNVAASSVIAGVWASCSANAGVVTFGSGLNEFQMVFVPIGNPGNSADTTAFPMGAVGYEYEIGKFEVSGNMIDKYNAAFGVQNSLEITKEPFGPNKPATSITWNEAARFVNWLNTSSGGFDAYKFTTNGVNDNIELWNATDDPLDYDANNRYRSKRANYVLPSHNEWHKAAYYDPLNAVYYNYETGSNDRPTAVSSGTDANTAVYNANDPADVDQAGGLSSYGVMGLAANAWEWEESSLFVSGIQYNADGADRRGMRGGWWSGDWMNFGSNSRSQLDPLWENRFAGFRVVSLSPTGGGEVPEPTSLVIFGLGTLGMAYRSRRQRKA